MAGPESRVGKNRRVSSSRSQVMRQSSAPAARLQGKLAEETLRARRALDRRRRASEAAER
jgi:hypothetical protein